jgi:hypothetical protein
MREDEGGGLRAFDGAAIRERGGVGRRVTKRTL